MFATTPPLSINLEDLHNGSVFVLHTNGGGSIPSSSTFLLLNNVFYGYKEKRCEKCNIDKWMNIEIPLELHHIDTNHSNNELNNIIILCPNCHAIEDAKILKEIIGK